VCPTLRHGQDQRLDEGLYIVDVQQDLVEYVLLLGEVRQRMYGTTRIGTSAEERRERETEGSKGKGQKERNNNTNKHKGIAREPARRRTEKHAKRIAFGVCHTIGRYAGTIVD